jgi:hypothetical protein
MPDPAPDHVPDGEEVSRGKQRLLTRVVVPASPRPRDALPFRERHWSNHVEPSGLVVGVGRRVGGPRQLVREDGEHRQPEEIGDDGALAAARRLTLPWCLAVTSMRTGSAPGTVTSTER